MFLKEKKLSYNFLWPSPGRLEAWEGFYEETQDHLNQVDLRKVMIEQDRESGFLVKCP
jgi:hypothetical protein